MAFYRKERRQQHRYRVPDKAKILIYPTKIAQIDLIDVSVGGIAFSCNDFDSFKKGQPITVNLIKNGLNYDDIPAVVANVIDLEKEFAVFRRCGIQFVNLVEEQQADLARVIGQIKTELL